jgi:hypothetical protein
VRSADDGDDARASGETAVLMAVAAAPSESCARTVRRLLVKPACEDASRECIRHLGFQQVEKRDSLFLFVDVQKEVL